MDFQNLYTGLFNACTDAIRKIDEQNYGAARDLLVLAQQKAEEDYLSQED